MVIATQPGVVAGGTTTWMRSPLGSVPRSQDKDGRDFEAGAIWLLQLLGFSSFHLGAMSKLNGEPDVLAQAPNGDVILVECTIDVPDDDKLANLISRTAKFAELLGACRNGADAMTITPILMCPLSPVQLAGIRAKAAENSILILHKKDTAHALRLAKFQPVATSCAHSDYYSRPAHRR